jgi:hypothetical protein
MEQDIIKNFVNRDVEVLVSGVWIEGHMTPVVKGVVTLLPYGEAAKSYGPTALKMDVIQAIRQVKKTVAAPLPPTIPEPADPSVRSALEQTIPGIRFVRK